MSTTNADQATTATTTETQVQKAERLSALIKVKSAQVEALRKEIATAREALLAIKGDARKEAGMARLEDAKAKAEARQTRIVESMGDCFCGCGIPHAPGKRFMQGHDARFWGMVTRIREGRESETTDTPEMVRRAIKEGWQKGGDYGNTK